MAAKEFGKYLEQRIKVVTHDIPTWRSAIGRVPAKSWTADDLGPKNIICNYIIFIIYNNIYYI